MRSILTATKTVMCTAAFVAAMVLWTVPYLLGLRRLDELLSRLAVWINKQCPED